MGLWERVLVVWFWLLKAISTFPQRRLLVLLLVRTSRRACKPFRINSLDGVQLTRSTFCPNKKHVFWLFCPNKKHVFRRLGSQTFPLKGRRKDLLLTYQPDGLKNHCRQLRMESKASWRSCPVGRGNLLMSQASSSDPSIGSGGGRGHDSEG